jgi:hypothetical protein
MTTMAQTGASAQRVPSTTTAPGAQNSTTERGIGNTWGLPANLANDLVRYPSPEVAFICGPQLRASSALNPFPWFESTAREQGIAHGERAARIAPIGIMNTDSPNHAWRNVIAGRVSVAARGTVVMGTGTAFTRDVDPSGPAPGYNGHFRIRDATGVVREVNVRSVESDTRLTLTAPWPYPSVNNTVADTFYHEKEFGTNIDHYFSANYYDSALVQYINYYRSGDQRFLDYARKIADAWWHSGWIGDGTIVDGDTHLPPRAMATAGRCCARSTVSRGMGLPERQVRYSFDDWVYKHKANTRLYYDIREAMVMHSFTQCCSRRSCPITTPSTLTALSRHAAAWQLTARPNALFIFRKPKTRRLIFSAGCSGRTGPGAGMKTVRNPTTNFATSSSRSWWGCIWSRLSCSTN